VYAKRCTLPTLGDTEAAAASPGGDATRAAYLAWAAQVKRLGGTPTAYPYHGTTPVLAWFDLFSKHDTYGLPAAKYPIAIADTFDQEPDQVSTPPGGNVAWFLAPVNVLRWAGSDEGIASLKNMQAAGNDQVPPENNDPDWYKQIKTAVKIVAIGGAVVIALQVIKLFPKPRDWE
jgi:hypothetical protein